MKEKDIRPADIFARYLELSRADAVELFGAASDRQDVPCPGCGDTRGQESFLKDGFRYCQCPACATLFASPRPRPEALDAFYGNSASATYWAEVFFPARMAARREQIFVPRVERILELMDERGQRAETVIDVGAGAGLFLDEFRKRRPGSTLLAVEPGRKLATVCRGLGFDTLEEPVERAGTWAGRGDLVACFEVIEHVHAPLAFATALAALVKPGGYLVLTSLGVEGFDIQVLWEKSKSVSPPHHLNFMSRRGFADLLARAGFSSVELLTPGRLDVDIVLNAASADPSIAAGNRFLSCLLESDEATRAAFQRFLAEHRLSSHTWVLARR